MVSELNRVNSISNEEEDKVIFSTDVKALYPSLKAEFVSDIIEEMYEGSELKIVVDVDELSLYLALVAEPHEIREKGLEPVVKKWRHEGGRGRRPGITSAEVMGGRAQRNDSKFLPADRKPNQREERKMIALAIKKGIQVVMENHLYTIDGKIYRQSEGGPIGLQATGAIARTFMIWWDKKFMERMREATCNMEWTCHMYMRYVDDGNMVCTPFPIGCDLRDGRVCLQDVNESDSYQGRNLSKDRNTAEIVQKLANIICDFIKVEIDYLLAHSRLHMPILDMEVAIQNNEVMNRHYRKIIANPQAIHMNSAMPVKVKMTCLANEVTRIMRNTKKEAPGEVKGSSSVSLHKECG